MSFFRGNIFELLKTASYKYIGIYETTPLVPPHHAMGVIGTEPVASCPLEERLWMSKLGSFLLVKDYNGSIVLTPFSSLFRKKTTFLLFYNDSHFDN